MVGRISIRLKDLLKNMLAFCIGLVLTIFLLEVFFRFLPVAGNHHLDLVNIDNPIMKFSPKNSTVIWSLGWNFYQISHKRINNEGFFNDNDYNEIPDKPVIAIIGDSYVEALQVDNNEAFFGILQTKYKDAYFYSFGASGSQLPTYLVYAKYALKYQPSKMIFVIISNDFDESFYQYKKAPGFWYFNDRGELYLIPYEPERNLYWKIRRIVAKNSALLRYLYFNIGLPYFLEKIKIRKNPSDILSFENRIQISKKAIDYFFDNLPQYINYLKPQDIIFIIDAPREYIYNNNIDGIKKFFFGITRDYFIIKAKSKGYKIIDMLPAFLRHYKEYKKKFEFPTDGHWNELGHYIVANELMKNLELYEKK